MPDRSGQQHQKHDPRAWDDEDNKPVIPKIPGPRTPQASPRVLAIRNAAAAADAHQAAPDTYTLHRMQSAVQSALNLGARPADIRAARQTAVK